MAEENEIIENIKKGCVCSYCHGGMKDQQAKCSCTRECNTLTFLQRGEKIALQHSSSGASTPDEALMWFACATFAEEIKFSEKALDYRKRGIAAYEKIGYFHDAKKWSELFGFIELVEYYQKLIELKASRPK